MTATQTTKYYDVVIVGAGFAGLYMLHRLRNAGRSVIVFERGDEVGGTWYWNRYPGARCDVESLQYCYSFPEAEDTGWRWSERFSAQPEIWAYARHIADKLDLRRDISFTKRVTAATFNEAKGRWYVETDKGDSVESQFCIMATGNLSEPTVPNLPGISDFKGAIYHTGAWPRVEPDFTGRRVGVIGTGSSGIQAVPELARRADEVVVFQRTANFSVPARNRPLTDDDYEAFKAQYPNRRAVARRTFSGTILPRSLGVNAIDAGPELANAEFALRWGWEKGGGASFLNAFDDLMVSRESNAIAADFVRQKIKEIVTDPEVAASLCPKGYPIGAKRLACDTGYYETFNSPNVKLVDLKKTPLECVTGDGLRTSEGEYLLDDLVFATGFDAGTGAISRIDVRGRQGKQLKDVWSQHPSSYLGLMIAGFPNLFTITGPGSPAILTNLLVSIEYHVEWIDRCIADLEAAGHTIIEPTEWAQEAWSTEVAKTVEGTLFLEADSWYMGANVEGKPRVFMAYAGGVHAYENRCETIVAQGYTGFDRRG
ncbi:NAD(P)/FAD-dependent oxidoreductase [Aminobacter sp. J44]|uniref:flavin-containing monooxygenase n=1 Tax=Aminobacter sp. J44 TaxID=935262 RepID=UPI00119B89A2|nr:NAD(P)/FAD-dependent oxidoreductase [Aminobacter sp. J44]TWG49828.1 cyclohexanone monooxygenase [Aminobacter sp. J44]